MSMKITVDWTPLERGRVLFEKYPERLQRALLPAMVESLSVVVKEIKDRVPHVSGTLRRSWNAELPPRAAGTGYVGRVGSNLDYARFIEFGFHGPEEVKAHSRSSCFGRPTRPFLVPAHTRTVNYGGSPYVRPGLAAAAPQVQQIHADAVEKATRGLGV